jgi:hypothetical protein
MGDKVSPPRSEDEPGMNIPCQCTRTKDGLMCACPFTVWVRDSWPGDVTKVICGWCGGGTHAFFS